MRTRPCFLVCLALSLALLLASDACSVINATKEDKLSDGLLSVLAVSSEKERIPVIVILEGDEAELNREVAERRWGQVKENFNIINGFSANLTKEGIKGLKDKSGVKKIYYDNIIYALPAGEDTVDSLSWNMDAVGATYVQTHSTLNYTGRNITIAIVDTGINYNHPDLGGGFGASYKVRGGYDFVNNDNNPMDDNGHGTHCAGIAAATNDVVTGVAPDARLLAVKVLNASGSGFESNAISGIDWALGNGADVISLSFGWDSKPADGYGALEMVVDAAVERGVVVVAAAGNSGPGSGSVGSPASANKVIGVGSNDCNGTAGAYDDSIASTSSRGPAEFGRFKPELVAPGVGISSTYIPNGAYQIMGGTSMATPHVAGAAAVLLEYNHSLTPGEIKSLLIHSTTNVSGHPFETGSGLLNVTRALTSKVVASINDEPLWEETVIPGMNATASLSLRNNGNTSVTLTSSYSSLRDQKGLNTISSGSLVLPGSITLAIGEEKTFILNFSCPQNTAAGTYGTIISFYGSGESVRIPFALTVPLPGSRSVVGVVDTDEDWMFYKIVNLNGTSFSVDLNWSDSDNDLDMYLFSPSGIVINESGEGGTVSEHMSLGDSVYPEYWVGVYAYSISDSSVAYNLSVRYTGTLRLSPESYYVVLQSNGSGTLNFTLINDGSAESGLTVNLSEYDAGAYDEITGTIDNVPPMDIVWLRSTGGLNLDNARYLTATLSWSNHLNNLDLYFLNCSETVCEYGAFESVGESNVSGWAEESLDNIDILQYLKTSHDIAIAINNSGSSQAYTLTLNFTDESNCDYGSVTPASISSLSGNANATLQVTINTSSLAVNRDYSPSLVVRDGSIEVARAPIRFTVSGGNVTDTTTTSTTTTTLPGPCELVGDYEPCDDVTLSEVVDLIQLWVGNEVSLSSVVNLIQGWVNS